MMENKTTRARNTEATTLYCCFRYDIAPLRTCRAIFAINSVPSLSFIICLKKNQANTSARIEATGMIQKIGVIIAMRFKFNPDLIVLTLSALRSFIVHL